MVITGKAAIPVYLWIDDGRVEIRDASALWGTNAYATAETLHRRHGSDTKFIAIGLAGEKLVRTATAFASHESALSCGFGAVMGSKNLKAILIRGSHKVSVADPDRLRELNRHMIKINKRIDFRMPLDLVATGHDHLVEIVGRVAATCAAAAASGAYSVATTGWKAYAIARPRSTTCPGATAGTTSRRTPSSTPPPAPTITGWILSSFAP